MKASHGLALAVTLLTTAYSATLATAQISDNNPDVVEIRHYRLTMDKLEKAAAASEQANALIASNPALKKRVDGQSDDASIDQKVRQFDTQFPEMTAIIHRNGLSTREYIVVSLALINDYMMVGMKKQGSIKDYPPNTVTPENAAFVEQNFDKLKAILDKMTPPDQSQQN